MRFYHKISLVALLSLLSAQPLHALIAGSYNIRYDNKGDVKSGDSWPQRLPVIAGLIRFHGFDVIGTQEAFLHQLLDLQKLLPDLAYTGGGRDDGKESGEHAAIFYRKDKFSLLESGTFWLSPTPDQPGKGWDADLPRICTWAKLRKTDGTGNLFVFNTHFDHRGVQARMESAKLIIEKIKVIANDEPVILTGDFNFDQNSANYKTLHESGFLSDTFETAADRYALNGTANAFKPELKTESRIDHIFHTRQFNPVRYGILTDTYRTPVIDSQESQSGNFPGEVRFRDFQIRLPSDHYPVLVEFE